MTRAEEIDDVVHAVADHRPIGGATPQ
jgi:hypothetical protein